jgi:uncharacterized protein YehS (DUF1456 family)
MSNFPTQNTTTDYIAMMMKRDETVVKIAARMESKAEEEAIKKYLKDDKAAAGQYDFKNFDSKSFASWAKSSSTPSEETNGRLKTF